MQGARPAGGGGAAETDVQDIALLLARFACNNHTICDNELRPIGAGHVGDTPRRQCNVLLCSTS